MQVKEVMSRELEEIPADAPLTEALKRLERQAGGVIAVYENGVLVGALTEHDINLWQGEPGHDLAGGLARDVMRQRRGTASEDQDVREAVKLMKEEHLAGLVVLKDDQPVGTVSLADVAARIESEVGVSTPIPARVFLQPVAAPSIIGLFGLATATFIIGAQMAGWYGGTTTPQYIFPFVALFGGLAQLLAGMWAYRARDGLATAIHGLWGTFFIAYGFLFLLTANGTLSLSAIEPGYGFWFIPVAAITAVCAIAALSDNGALAIQQLALTAASAVSAIALLAGNGNWTKVGGYVFLLSAVMAYYVASALLFEGSFRRVLLPIGRMRLVAANRLGSTATRPVEYKFGEPGVRMGQ